MPKREQKTDFVEETSDKVKKAKRDFDPIHYMGKTEYDLNEIFEEVDNGKYTFTLRSFCPGMAKTILKYKSVIFEHLSGKFNFASIQTICRAEAFPGFSSNFFAFNDSISNHDDPPAPAVLPLCIQMVIQVNSRRKKEFITQALKDLGFFGKKRRSPLFCSGGSKRICPWGCFKVADRLRNCLFDKGANCHYLQTADCKYSYSAEY